jgi:opacity protein-like surface antigen
MRVFTVTSVAVLSLLFIARPLVAQERWRAEVRGGVNIAVDEFTAVDLKTGAGLEIGLGVRLAPGLFEYGAWDWQNRAAETRLFGVTADVEDTGYAFGLQYVALLAGRTKPWIRGGGLFNHVEIEDEDSGDLFADSEHTWGVEIGGGVDVALSDRWSLTPGVRYRRFEPQVRYGGVETSATLSYVVVDVGLTLKF